MESHIYTPEVESYAFEDIILWKIEKVLVKVTDKNPQLYYICTDEDGFRTVLSDEDDEVGTFILAAPGVIRESTLSCVQGNFVESAQNDVIEELVKYGIKSVLKEDGTICPIEDYENLSDDSIVEVEDKDEYEDSAELVENLIVSRDKVVGLPIDDGQDGIVHEPFIELTEEEASMLEGEINVSVYNGGPYFPNRCALVKETGEFVKRGTERVCIDLHEAMWQYHDAIHSKWEKNNYGHDFEDFVIEVFELKVTKGNVRVNIELGS